MYGKLLVCILLGSAVYAGAQGVVMTGKVARTVAKASAQAVERQAALASVRTSNVQLGKEAFRLHVSGVGVGNYAQKARRFAVASSLVPSKILLESLQNRDWILKPLPGYISSSKDLSFFSCGAQAVLLNNAYGFEAKYRGVFVRTFEELRSLSFRPVDGGTDALSALQAARVQAAEGKTGFLALAVKGNAHRPKDILVWNGAEKRWISWNYSKAAVLRNEYETLKTEFKDQNVYWTKLLERQGVVVRPDSYDEPSSIRVSADGVNWQEFDLNTSAGADLWDAWSQKLYIHYNRHSRTARFALNKTSPEFSSPELVFLWKEAADMAVGVTENVTGLPVFSLDGKVFPNLYSYGPDGKLQSAPGIEFKVNEFFPMEPLRFMRELQKISTEELIANPAAKVVFLEKKARLGDFNTVRECVEIR